MAISFKNSPKTFFLISLISLVVVSAAAGVFNRVYLATKKGEDSLGEVRFGTKKSLKDLFNEKDIHSPWLENGNYYLEARMKTGEEETSVVSDIVNLDKENKLLSFDGIGEGTLYFICSFDYSIYYNLDFKIDFKDKNLAAALKTSYASLFEDNCLTKEEISQISEIRINNLSSFDASDLGYFPSLNNLTVNGETVTKFSNVNLKDDMKIYVSKELYGDYMALESLKNYRDIIFPEKKSNQTYMVVLEKNNGVLANSWDKSYDCFEVEQHQPCAQLPGEDRISLLGNNFMGWFDNKGKEYNNSSIITQDVKLEARWTYKTYFVNYLLDEIEYNDEFSYTDDLVIRDFGDSLDDEEKLLIGWSTSIDSTAVEFAPAVTIDDYFDGYNLGLDLYPVYAWRRINIRIYNGEEVILNTSCDYGNSFILHYPGSEPLGEGKFAGYSMNKNAVSKDYEDNIAINISLNIDNLEDHTYIYRTISQDNTLSFYCIFDPTDQFSIFYVIDEENTYTQTYSIDGDASSGTLVPGRSVTFMTPDQFWNRGFTNIDQTGKHFAGWQRSVGGETTIYTNLNTFGSNYVHLNNYVLDGGFSACENVTLVPVYVNNSMTIQYSDSTANSLYSSASVNYGNSLTHNGSCRKNGCDLKGFKIYANNTFVGTCGTESYLDQETMKSLYNSAKSAYGFTRHNDANNMILKFVPQWDLIPYTVHFDVGNSDSVISDQIKYYGDKVTKPSNPKNKDSQYEFQYWTLNDSQFDFSTHIVEGSITLKAYYKKKCIAAGSLISMKDGSKKPVENINLGDEIKTWNFKTGDFNYNPVVYIQVNEIISTAFIMKFENGQTMKAIGKHAFFDYTLKEFVEVSENYNEQYIGDYFFFEDGLSRLISVDIVPYHGYSYVIMPMGEGNSFANGLLNTITEYIAFSKVASITDEMKFDEDELAHNIDIYGIADYNDYQDYLSPELFYAFDGQYLNILFGLGLMTYEQLQSFNKDCSDCGGVV